MARTKVPAQKSAGQYIATKAPRKRPAGLEGPNRRPKQKPAARALLEIRKYQRLTEFLISKKAFQRLIREIMEQLYPGHEFKFQRVAIEALQEAAEAIITAEFEVTNLLAIHASRITINTKDMRLARTIRETFIGGATSYNIGHGKKAF
ncbi:histone-fold-containing protein [Tothia fuscella]|uniref:Histone-fold-containing protein n=1 Tax=Tothia fuscella TaxID=1048955 RepID=A0A9P4NE26_9PEZI|nr:histone-fold-containing protein [Tothia fuscella]